MKKLLLLLCVVIMETCFVHTALAKEGSKIQEKKVICNKKFQVMSLNGEKDLGTYSIKAIMDESKKKIKIIESLSMNYRGKRASMKSSVIYGNTSSLAPKKCAAETKIDGKTCMKGTVTFSDKTFDLECTGFLNKRTGEAIIPPKRFVKKDQTVAKGMLIFQSALPAIGPRFLPKEGELKNVVFVEFPDDLGAPELINFKEGYRLIRGKPNEEGEYDMKLYGQHSDKCISHIRFGKDDQIVSMVLFGKMKLVEIEEEKN